MHNKLKIKETSSKNADPELNHSHLGPNLKKKV